MKTIRALEQHVTILIAEMLHRYNQCNSLVSLSSGP